MKENGVEFKQNRGRMEVKKVERVEKNRVGLRKMKMYQKVTVDCKLLVYIYKLIYIIYIKESPTPTLTDFLFSLPSLPLSTLFSGFFRLYLPCFWQNGGIFVKRIFHFLPGIQVEKEEIWLFWDRAGRFRLTFEKLRV